jgi:hypothetical protein
MFVPIKSQPAHLAWLVGLILFACGSTFAQDIHYNVMPGTSFSKYHTYKWINLPGMHPDQIVDQEIKQAVDQQLAEKGFSKTDGDNADLYVGYQCAIDKEKQLNGFADGFGGFGPGGWGFGDGGMFNATTSTIENGSLVVNVFDPTTKQLVWTGTATKTLNPGKNQQKNVNQLDKAVNKLLKNFPPPPNK